MRNRKRAVLVTAPAQPIPVIRWCNTHEDKYENRTTTSLKAMAPTAGAATWTNKLYCRAATLGAVKAHRTESEWPAHYTQRVFLKQKTVSCEGCISRLPRHQTSLKAISIWRILGRQPSFHVLHSAEFEGCMGCILHDLQSPTILCTHSISWK